MDKELRVSSRRKRNYFFRCIYVVLLLLFVSFVWVATIERGAISQALRVSQMNAAGISITVSVLWFQFIMTQIITASTLSTTISDEIRKKTIGILMVTPITGLQIVLGKLLSNLLQLMILLAISLPILAIVRLFGGIPAEYVISSFCMIVVAALLTGAISLYFSISQRKNRRVISNAISILLLLYLGLPALLQLLCFYYNWPWQIFKRVLVYINPFYAMSTHTSDMLMPGWGGSFFSWPLHCLAILAGTLIVIILAARKVRKTVLTEPEHLSLMYYLGRLFGFFLPRQTRAKIGDPNTQARNAAIRPIKGSPIAWKEAHASQNNRRTVAGVVGKTILVLAIVASYIYFWRRGWLFEKECQTAYVLAYILLGICSLVINAAGAIAAEKEARTWPILLTVPLGNFQIILAKSFGVFRRTLPIWFLLLAHLTFYCLFRQTHFSAIIHMILIVISSVVLCISVGLFFSVMVKKSTTAVNLTIGTLLGFALILPSLFSVGSGRDSVTRLFFSANPVYQAGIVMEATAEKRYAKRSLDRLRYKWPMKKYGFGKTTFYILSSMLVYCLLSLALLIISAKNLRRNIFDQT